LARSGRHHDLNFRSTLAQPPDKVRAFVGGNAARHAEQDALALHAEVSFHDRVIIVPPSPAAQTTGRNNGISVDWPGFAPSPSPRQDLRLPPLRTRDPSCHVDS